MIVTDLKTMWHTRLVYLHWGVLRGQRCSRGAAARRCTPKDAATPLWPPHWLQTPPASPVKTDISMKPCKSIEENVEGCAAATRIEALYSTGHANSAHKNLLLAKSSTRRQKSKGRQSAGGVSSVSTSSTREAWNTSQASYGLHVVAMFSGFLDAPQSLHALQMNVEVPVACMQLYAMRILLALSHYSTLG